MHASANEPSMPADDAYVPSNIDFPVVGIGASAGGLQALLSLFENMPESNGMAFVVVLHLSPKHHSSADAILQRVTRMPVVQVTGPVPIRADHVYVIPPNKQLSMVDGHLSLTELERPRGGHVAIDIFFRTLAETHRARAVAIVLSGTGSDGAVGLARVKEQGGVTLVQSPADAEHEGMPQAAIRTGMVDSCCPSPTCRKSWSSCGTTPAPSSCPPAATAKRCRLTCRPTPTPKSPRMRCTTSSPCC